MNMGFLFFFDVLFISGYVSSTLLFCRDAGMFERSIHQISLSFENDLRCAGILVPPGRDSLSIAYQEYTFLTRERDVPYMPAPAHPVAENTWAAGERAGDMA
jgi:hypothetical protein